MNSIPKKLNNHKKGDAPWRFKKNQIAWNKGTGGCKKGHDPSYYKEIPSGVFVCLECKRVNGRKYRSENKEKILMKGRGSGAGLTIEEFNDMYDSQEGRCATCKSSVDKDKCALDHNHKDGRVRGILCRSCNTGIGLLKDSVFVLESAAKYLEERA